MCVCVCARARAYVRAQFREGRGGDKRLICIMGAGAGPPSTNQKRGSAVARSAASSLCVFSSSSRSARGKRKVECVRRSRLLRYRV